MSHWIRSVTTRPPELLCSSHPSLVLYTRRRWHRYKIITKKSRQKIRMTKITFFSQHNLGTVCRLFPTNKSISSCVVFLCASALWTSSSPMQSLHRSFVGISCRLTFFAAEWRNFSEVTLIAKTVEIMTLKYQAQSIDHPETTRAPHSNRQSTDKLLHSKKPIHCSKINFDELVTVARGTSICSRHVVCVEYSTSWLASRSLLHYSAVLIWAIKHFTWQYKCDLLFMCFSH